MFQNPLFYTTKEPVLPYENVGTVMHYTSDGYAIAILLSDLLSY